MHVVSDVRRPLGGHGLHGQAAVGQAARTLGDGVATSPPDSCVRVGTIQFVVADAPGELWLDLVVEHGDEVATNRYVSTIVR